MNQPAAARLVWSGDRFYRVIAVREGGVLREYLAPAPAAAR